MTGRPALSRAVLLLIASLALAGAACKKPTKPAPGDGGVGAGSARLPIAPDGGIDRAAVAATFDRQCVAGNLEACRNLGIMYSEGAGVTADPRRATALFAQACNAGNVASCNHLAMAFMEGLGVPKDPARAVEIYGRACDAGYGLACRNLGLALREGRGVAPDLARAAELLDRACRASVPYACTNAGDLAAQLATAEAKAGKPVAARKKQMVDHFKRGCDSRDPTACRQLGILYLEGFGLPKSAGAAAVWLGRGCDGEDALACRVLGLMNRDGVGVPRDIDRGMKLLRRACERNDADACGVVAAASGSTPGSAAPRPLDAGTAAPPRTPDAGPDAGP